MIFESFDEFEKKVMELLGDGIIIHCEGSGEIIIHTGLIEDDKDKQVRPLSESEDDVDAWEEEY